MTSRIDLEWDTTNLLRTAEHFLRSPGAQYPVGVNGPLKTVDEAQEFLLGKLENQFQVLPIPTDFQHLHCDCFVVYKSVWVSLVLSNTTVHCGNDRTMGLLREHDVLERQDAGLLSMRTIDLKSDASSVLLAKITFLTNLS